MKKALVALLSAVYLGFSGLADATLWDRGGGLIYDDVLDITWLQDANYAKTSGPFSNGRMTWSQANAWAESLIYFDIVRNVWLDDWRLPHTLPVNGRSYNHNYSYDGSTDLSHNVSAPGSAYPGSTGSELAYMFYNSLGNKSIVAPDETFPQPGWGLQNTGPFQNLKAYFYWSGTVNGFIYPNSYWLFDFKIGSQDYGLDLDNWDQFFYAWPVRDGDIAGVPAAEPASIFLLGLGLLGVAAHGRKLGGM